MIRDVVIWWEKMRLFYNLIVLPVGLLSLYFLSNSGLDVSYSDLFEGVLFYSLFLNLCYCAGPLLDFYSIAIFHNRVKGFNLVLWCVGLGIGVVLTITLGLIAVLDFGLPDQF